MSKDRTSSMLAAGDCVDVPTEDAKGKKVIKQYRLRPVVAQQLCDLENDALRFYKRSYLETFSENADLLGKEVKDQILREEMMKVARWDLSDLPQKEAYDVTFVPLSEKLKKELTNIYGELPTQDDGSESVEGIRGLLSNALDTKSLSREKVKDLTGFYPITGRVRYDQWWVTASTEGMLSFVTSSVRHCHPELTKNDVANWPFTKIVEAAHLVEKLTAASMGNG